MPKPTMFTNAMNRAHGDILRGFNLALEKYATVPLGHDHVDPRTIKSRADAAASSLNPTPMNSLPVAQKPAPKKNNPTPTGGQSLRNKMAGKVVDPTAIESAQAADSTTVDSSSGHASLGGPFLD